MYRSRSFVVALCTGPECKKQYRAVFLASRKVYFLTVWASENTEDLQRVARVVDIEQGKLRLRLVPRLSSYTESLSDVLYILNWHCTAWH